MHGEGNVGAQSFSDLELTLQGRISFAAARPNFSVSREQFRQGERGSSLPGSNFCRREPDSVMELSVPLEMSQLKWRDS